MNVAVPECRQTDDERQPTMASARSPAFQPLFLGDWTRALFVHYEVDLEVLQKEIPLELDLWNGKAFVSLVAFNMERLRLRFGGRLWELVPISRTRFLNVRTYVRQRNRSGIYFMTEFLSNRLFVPLGRPAFGLPYRAGHLDYRHDHESGVIEGSVKSAGDESRLAYRATPASAAGFEESHADTLDSFLLERYAAFTRSGQKSRFFHVWHQPWPQARMEVVVQDEGLLATTGEWIHHARLVGGHYSPGVRDVWMGRPQRIYPPEPRKRLTVFFDI
jgi:uncharacterized protein